jgi:hypothetical protein
LSAACAVVANSSAVSAASPKPPLTIVDPPSVPDRCPA